MFVCICGLRPRFSGYIPVKLAELEAANLYPIMTWREKWIKALKTQTPFTDGNAHISKREHPNIEAIRLVVFNANCNMQEYRPPDAT